MAVKKEKEVNLHHAMVNVMQEVKNIEKGLTVGSGSFSYKGVSDKDVKQQIGQAMAKNGLTCVPIKFEPTTKIERWTEENEWKGKVTIKQKVSIFVEVLATFRITHADTKESIDIVGYGHGQDNSDKAAGKATTYALKNALLYSFLVPTGEIDDTDNTHSNDIQQAPPAKPVMTDKEYNEALPHILSGKVTIAQAELKYQVSVEFKNKFQDALDKVQKEEQAKVESEGAAKMTAKSETVVEPAPKVDKVEKVDKVDKVEAPKATDTKETTKTTKSTTKTTSKKKEEPKVEDAIVVEGEEHSSKDRILEHIASFTSSERLLKEKSVVKLDMKLQNLTEEETKEIGLVFNEKYSQLIEKGL